MEWRGGNHIIPEDYRDGWTLTEERIIRSWMKQGMSRQEAESRLLDDLHDAAEEDGYDGP